MIRTIYWEDNSVVMIDQNALPLEEKYLICRDYKKVVSAIKDMTIRGAPAIGVAAALGITLGLFNISTSSEEDIRSSFYEICSEFASTRPTARNLFWAIERMKRRFEVISSSPIVVVRKMLLYEALRILDEDIATNKKIGFYGNSLIDDGDSILTHCNAGALATAAYGTALGVVRAASETGKKIHVYADETRPVLQGARLTAWELMKENIPVTLISDNMAGFLMRQGKVSKVIVGADRIASNGDVANKIGTYSLSILAKAHGIPFYVAAPLSTIDFATKRGEEIPIEERNSAEITKMRGVQIAPYGTTAYNPAFDITPSNYITAIVTEAGVIREPFEINIPRLAGLTNG